jgi:RHS repeat-associated protein
MVCLCSLVWSPTRELSKALVAKVRITTSMMQAQHNYDSDVYYRARYYDPNIGRFLSEDPIRFWGGIDFYKYVDNNPANATDPSGNWVYYGNWCGPDWTGGKRESYDPSHDFQYKTNAGGQSWWVSYYLIPTDGLDAACKTHDICYYNCRNTFGCDKGHRKSCMAACNHNLASDARASGVHNQWESKLAWEMDTFGPTDSMVGADDKSCQCSK